MHERGPRPETIPEIESILSKNVIEEILDHARLQLLDDALSPTLFTQMKSGERVAIPLSIPEVYQEKRIYFTLLGHSFREVGNPIQEAILVSETWVVLKPDPSDLQIAPSQHPQRQEAITLVGRNVNNDRSAFAIQPFHWESQRQLAFDELHFELFNAPTQSRDYATGLLDYLFHAAGVA